jgi:hypothetical protein
VVTNRRAKNVLFPGKIHLMCVESFPKTDWAKVDHILRPELKATPYVTQEASNEYIYGVSRKGGAASGRGRRHRLSI